VESQTVAATWLDSGSDYAMLTPRSSDRTTALRQAYQAPMTPTLELGAYVSLVRVLPKPTSEQMATFADHLSRAHSWYKHLPWFPPGQRFQVFLDPAAGMQRTVTRSGEICYSKRDKQGHHYSWIPTEQYLSNFGHLAFAQSAGTSVSLISTDGTRKVPSDDEALVYNPQREQLCRPPQEILDAGAAFVSGIIHPSSGNPEAWGPFTMMRSLDPELMKAGLESVTTPAGQGKTFVVASAPESTGSQFKYRLNLAQSFAALSRCQSVFRPGRRKAAGRRGWSPSCRD